MKNVLIVNQSAELYGADKAILELICNFPKNFRPIVVVHEEGPFKKILEEKGIQVIKCSVIKVKRGILKPNFFLNLPLDYLKSVNTIKKALGNEKIDLIHSNATSVFLGAFMSFFQRIPHVWHVHEIIVEPKKIAYLYPKVVHFFSDFVIFNSMATSNHFISKNKKLFRKSGVVYNGQTRNIDFLDNESITQIRENDFKITRDKIVIGLVGRISKIKGQFLLLKSFQTLTRKYSNIHLVFIGSTVASQESFLEKLKDKVNEFGLEKNITFIDFRSNIWPIYDALDIVVVPSIEQESFGLVATEGMLSNKPVIAANHGGLCEIVIDNETGLFFEPRNSGDLAKKIEVLILNPDLRDRFGKNGHQRVKDFFSTQKYISSIEKIYLALSSNKN